MQYRIDQEIAAFHKRCLALEGSAFTVRNIFPGGYIITPISDNLLKLDNKFTIGLSLSGIIHGNETGGIGVLNGLLELMGMGAVPLNFPLGIFLGNLEAAPRGMRYFESDLNRSFLSADASTYEGKRAKEIEKILLQTRFFLDYHQTLRKSELPFFIFPFSKEGFMFSRLIAPQTSVVTHWGKGFSKLGKCSDECVNANDGTGITIELGQCGFDPYQIGFGVSLALRTIAVVNKFFREKSATLFDFEQVKELYEKNDEPAGDVLTWAGVMSYPATGVTKLDDGWYNFRAMEKGERVAVHDGKPILATESGWMLFPGYGDGDHNKKPEELCRIVKKIPYTELPW